jgi:hypothetical protein
MVVPNGVSSTRVYCSRDHIDVSINLAPMALAASIKTTKNKNTISQINMNPSFLMRTTGMPDQFAAHDTIGNVTSNPDMLINETTDVSDYPHYLLPPVISCQL